MKKLGAQIVFATFLVMLSTAVLTVTVILLLQFLGALPQGVVYQGLNAAKVRVTLLKSVQY